MHYWVYIFVALILLATACVCYEAWTLRKKYKTSARFNKLIQTGNLDKRKYLSGMLSHVLKKGLIHNAESTRLFLQAGWGSKFAKTIFWGLGRILPLVLALLTFLISISYDLDLLTAVMRAIFLYSIVYVGANFILRKRAKIVSDAVVKELIPFLHMLRMLFNAGLSLERVLLILMEQSGSLFPNLSGHLKRMQLNLHAGQDQADALMQMAKSLHIPELTEAVSMIYQVSKYGGNVQASLGNFISVMHNRQFSALRERVSKLSAKMSMVMIIFMFPALIIFIAGPGFIGISKVLSGNAV